MVRFRQVGWWDDASRVLESLGSLVVQSRKNCVRPCRQHPGIIRQQLHIHEPLYLVLCLDHISTADIATLDYTESYSRAPIASIDCRFRAAGDSELNYSRRPIWICLTFPSMYPSMILTQTQNGEYTFWLHRCSVVLIRNGVGTTSSESTASFPRSPPRRHP